MGLNELLHKIVNVGGNTGHPIHAEIDKEIPVEKEEEKEAPTDAAE